MILSHLQPTVPPSRQKYFRCALTRNPRQWNPIRPQHRPCPESPPDKAAAPAAPQPVAPPADTDSPESLRISSGQHSNRVYSPAITFAEELVFWSNLKLPSWSVRTTPAHSAAQAARGNRSPGNRILHLPLTPYSAQQSNLPPTPPQAYCSKSMTGSAR